MQKYGERRKQLKGTLRSVDFVKLYYSREILIKGTALQIAGREVKVNRGTVNDLHRGRKILVPFVTKGSKNRSPWAFAGLTRKFERRTLEGVHDGYYLPVKQ